MAEISRENSHRQLFLSRYHDIHDRIIPLMVDPLSEEQLRKRPGDVLNPIAWMLWHMFRAEDVGLNRLVTDATEVLDEEDWPQSLQVKMRYAGTGMTAQEVSDLCGEIRIPALRAYGKAVHERTLQVVANLTEAALEEVPSDAHIRLVMCEEQVLPESAWSYLPLYYGKSKRWFLMHLGLSHSYYHLGQIALVKKLLT